MARLAPEFSRPVVLATLPPGGREARIAADQAERAALARRFALVSLDALEAELRVFPESGATGGARVRGSMSARVVQSCVVTLEPVSQSVSEPVDWQVVATADAAGADDDEGATEVVVADDPDGPDPVEAQGGLLDLGEALAQQLSLAIDPYPRSPGAALGDGARGDEDEAAERAPNALAAALSRLRRPG